MGTRNWAADWNVLKKDVSGFSFSQAKCCCGLRPLSLQSQAREGVCQMSVCLELSRCSTNISRSDRLMLYLSYMEEKGRAEKVRSSRHGLDGK